MKTSKYYDKYKVLDLLKTGTKVALATAVFLASFYIIPSLIVLYITKKRNKKAELVAGTIFIISLIVCIGTHDMLDFIKHSWDFWFSFKQICSCKIMIGSAFFLFANRMAPVWNSTVSDWMIEDAVCESESYVKEGEFDYNCNSNMLVTGTTGSGKTTFIEFLCKYFLKSNRFVAVVTGKISGNSSNSLVVILKKLAKKYDRKLYVFSMNPDIKNTIPYNPFKYSSWAEMNNVLANMITFSEEHYKAQFVKYMGIIYRALKRGNKTVSMPNVMKIFDSDILEGYLDEQCKSGIISDAEYQIEMRRLNKCKNDAITSASRIENIFNEETMPLFSRKGKKSISILDARRENAIILFDLNGTSAAELTRAIGTMIVGDMQHLISVENKGDERKLFIFDEFSYYASDIFLPLYNQGRENGFMSVAATQSFSDIDRVDTKLKSALIENSNQFGILRQNEEDDANTAASIIGSVQTTEITKRIDGINYSEKGSQKVIHTYAVHPNIIKNLDTCEMIYVKKINSRTGIHEPYRAKIMWDYHEILDTD